MTEDLQSLLFQFCELLLFGFFRDVPFDECFHDTLSLLVYVFKAGRNGLYLLFQPCNLFLKLLFIGYGGS